MRPFFAWGALGLLGLLSQAALASNSGEPECVRFRRSVLTRDRLHNQQMERRAFVNVGSWSHARKSWQPTSSALSPRARVTVVNFWAHFCEPCIREMPTLVTAMHEVSQGRGTDVQLILLAEQSSSPDMQEFLALHPSLTGLSYLHDTGGVIRRSITSDSQLPLTVVLDENLVVRYAVIGAIEDFGLLKEQVERLLRNGR